jgi:predicted porin
MGTHTKCRSTFALAAMALMHTPLSAQGVTVYGQVRLTANHVKTGSASGLEELRDNASRLGFRGVEDLGDGLTALFGLEMGLNADTGTQADANALYRHSYAALRGALGTVAMGRLDSGNPTGSPLYSQVTALTHFAPNDAGATAIGTSMLNARNRTSNSIGYISPRAGGFDLRVRGYLRGAGTAAEPEQAARSLDVGLNYAAGAVKAVLGWAKDERSGGLANNEFDDKWQAGVNFNFGGFEVYALGGRDRYRNTAATRRTVDYGIVGTAVRQGLHKVVLNVLRRDVQNAPTGVRDRWQIGYQYALSKRTELQAFHDNDGIDSSRTNVRVRAVGVGIRHDF